MWPFLSLTLLATTLGLPPTALAQSSPPEPEDLFGPVSEVIIEERVVAGSSASSQGEGSRREVLRFENGRLTEQSNYIPRNNLLWNTSFHYQENGRLSSRTSVDGRGNLRWRYEYLYTDDGKLEREVVRGPGEVIEEILVYEYVSDRLQEQTMFDAGNRVRWRKAFRYDERNNRRSWSVFHADGTRIKQVEEEFDRQGRRIRESHTDGLGAVYTEVFYEYGIWDAPVRVEVFDGSGALIRYEVRQMDVAGNVILQEISRRDAERDVEIVRELTYDEHGNWTRENTRSVVITDGRRRVTREKLVTRDITYTAGQR
ncbi:MAG: hypothetical protein ACOC28_01995 [Alkalispirochaetaceae bacterium]